MTYNLINQVCTATDLIEGNFENSFHVKDIILDNDFGLGTFNRLNGEMIIYDGKIYRSKYNGEIEETLHDRSPFIIATKFKQEKPILVYDLNDEQIKNKIKLEINQKLIYAVKIEGSFSIINLRSSAPIKKPYPNFTEILKGSNNYKVVDIEGVIVGFYFPLSFEKISTSGFHFHFIDNKRKIGGHVVDFKIKKAQIFLDKKTHFNLSLPTLGS
jgi:acetolactate decarboxylase